MRASAIRSRQVQRNHASSPVRPSAAAGKAYAKRKSCGKVNFSSLSVGGKFQALNDHACNRIFNEPCLKTYDRELNSLKIFTQLVTSRSYSCDFVGLRATIAGVCGQAAIGVDHFSRHVEHFSFKIFEPFSASTPIQPWKRTM